MADLEYGPPNPYQASPSDEGYGPPAELAPGNYYAARPEAPDTYGPPDTLAPNPQYQSVQPAPAAEENQSTPIDVNKLISAVVPAATQLTTGLISLAKPAPAAAAPAGAAAAPAPPVVSVSAARPAPPPPAAPAPTPPPPPTPAPLRAPGSSAPEATRPRDEYVRPAAMTPAAPQGLSNRGRYALMGGVAVGGASLVSLFIWLFSRRSNTREPERSRLALPSPSDRERW